MRSEAETPELDSNFMTDNTTSESTFEEDSDPAEFVQEEFNTDEALVDNDTEPPPHEVEENSEGKPPGLKFFQSLGWHHNRKR